jgi:hypothetical protein
MMYTTKFIEDILKENNLEPNDVNEIITHIKSRTHVRLFMVKRG